MAAGEAYKRKTNQVAAQARRLEKARRDAQARLGCDCGASKDEIRTEQARLRADYYARQETRP